MKLTAEQRNIVASDDTLMVSACPGSGKTRVIISKIVRLLDNLRDGCRSVACITYTNVAVHEIEDRLQIHLRPDDDRYFSICTIHSFCLNHIFRPFCHLVDGYEEGFKLLTPESEEFAELVGGVCEGFNRLNLTYRDLEEFGQLRMDIQGRPIGNAIDSGSITAPMAVAYWDALKRAGAIDFANIIFHSYRLLRTHNQILRYVAAKFSWVSVGAFSLRCPIFARPG